MGTNHWQAPDKDLLAQLDAAYVRWWALCEQVVHLEGASQEKLQQLQQEIEWLQWRQTMHHTRSSANHVRKIIANMQAGEVWVNEMLAQIAADKGKDAA